MALLQQVQRQMARSTAPSGRWPAAGRSGTDRPVGWPGRRRWPRRGWAIGTDFGKLCGAGRWSGGRTATLHPPERPTVGSVCKWGPGAAKCSRATCRKISLKKSRIQLNLHNKTIEEVNWRVDKLSWWINTRLTFMSSSHVCPDRQTIDDWHLAHTFDGRLSADFSIGDLHTWWPRFGAAHHLRDVLLSTDNNL